jgi:hypothetical protein
MWKVILLASFVSLSLYGCVSASPKAQSIKEADERMIANCEFLGTISSSSGWGGVAREGGLQNAKNDALNKAAEKGATHLIWTNVDESWWSPRVAGRAYLCK